MFVWTFDLRALLLIMLFLPVAGGFLALFVIRLLRRRRQKEAQAALLAPLFAQAPLGLLIFNQERSRKSNSRKSNSSESNSKSYNLLQTNDTALRLLQISEPAAKLPDLRWARLLQKDLQEAGRYRTVEIAAPVRGSDAGTGAGARVVRWWIARHQQLALVLLFDITNEQQAEQSANQLLSDLSHELRTPLATVLPHLEVLSLPTISAEVQQQSLQFMKDETQRLVRMSNRTLELGRLQSSASIEPRAVALHPLAESIVAQMQVEAAAKEVHIIIEADELLSPVSSDPDQLRQVLLNLLDNAVKYGGNRNRIVVSIQSVAKGDIKGGGYKGYSLRGTRQWARYPRGTFAPPCT